MKLLKSFTLVLLILFPFGELLRADIGNYVAWKLLDIVIFATVTTWLIVYRKKLTRYIKFSYILFPLIGFIALIFNLHWLQQSEALTAFLYLLRWVMYAGLFFVVREFSGKFKQTITSFMFIDGLMMVLFGFLQYFFYNNIRIFYYLGWDNHMHRIFSTFLDPNFAGGFFVLYFIFVAGLLFTLLTKHAVDQYKKIKICGFSITLILTIIAVFLTFSRASILMLIASSIIFLILIGKKKLIIGILLTVFSFGIVASPFFYDENMNLFRVQSSKARLLNYSFALRVIADRPLLGVGFNSYRYTKRLYGVDYDWVKLPSHADAGADNSFLFVLATTGVTGFLAYLFLWYLILKQAFEAYQKKRSMYSVIIIASAGGLFVHALFINSLFYAPFMLWMWFVIALSRNR